MEKACERFEQVLITAPGDPEALAALGQIYLLRGDYKRSITLLEQSLSVRPENIQAQLMLTQVYRHMKKLPKAIACARKALRVDSAHGQANLVLGDLLWEKGSPSAAREHWRLAKHANPNLVTLEETLAADTQIPSQSS
jgi:tetratricopeptide (TPR) repeat protein